MDISYYKKYEPIFNEWHIVREIGEGSFGKVFEIEREDFGYTYKSALKVITIPQSKSEIKSALASGMDKDSATDYFRSFVEEMVGEFVLMNKLKGNSNIVSYEDHKVYPHEDGIGWDILIRMELLTPFVEYAADGRLSRNDVIKLGTDMCRALEACHKYQIIHRDIKLENIFVSDLGDNKLGDFGIAKTVEKTMGGLSKKGTYTYMAPEIYKSEPYGTGVDIYSLGIVLYMLLNNNRTPFMPEYPKPIKYSDRDASLVRRISGEAIPAPANVDKALSEVILKACAYKPEDRYKSPTEMREALEAVAKAEYKESASIAIERCAEASDDDIEATVGAFGNSARVIAKATSTAAYSGETSDISNFTDNTPSVEKTSSTNEQTTDIARVFPAAPKAKSEEGKELNEAEKAKSDIVKVQEPAKDEISISTEKTATDAQGEKSAELKPEDITKKEPAQKKRIWKETKHMLIPIIVIILACALSIAFFILPTRQEFTTTKKVTTTNGETYITYYSASGDKIKFECYDEYGNTIYRHDYR